jgi:hypothetical protein
MHSLLWKEWHEQRWKLAFGSLILAAFALIGLRARVVADAMLLEWVCVLAVLLLPVLASTGLLPAERNDGTLAMLLALPTHPRLIFAVKTMLGVLLCAGPLIVTAAVSVAVAGGREVSTAQMSALYLRTLAATLSLFFWMFALTVRLPTETRAALISLGVLIVWLIVNVGLNEAWTDDVAPSVFWIVNPFVFLFGYRAHYGWTLSMALAAGRWPGGSGGATAGTWAVSLAFAGLVQSIIALALWLWAAKRLASEAGGRS